MPLKEFKADLLPGIKELSINVKKELLTTAMSGELASRLKGRGIEFEDYREYNTTDDSSRIDWRASQRSQKVLVREYKVDVNFNVFFLIDVSETMLFASSKKLKCEYAAEVINSIFYGILGSGNSTGFGLFSDKMVKIVKPMLGQKQYHLFAKEISDVKNYGGGKDLGLAVRQTMSLLDRKTLIFIVSDFIGVSDKLADYLKIMTHIHDVIGIRIVDKRDLEIPNDAGQFVFQDPYSNKSLYIDSKQYAPIYRQEMKMQVNLVRTVFQKTKSKLLELRTDENFYNPLLKFFRRIGARWR